MKKLFTDNDSSEGWAHNTNFLPDKNRLPNANNRNNISDCRGHRRNKSNITTKNLNIFVHQPHRLNVNGPDRGEKSVGNILHSILPPNGRGNCGC